MRVRQAVERALSACPHALLITTGHSLGGSLATLCAYDLLTASPAARAAGCTCVTFGGNRFVNRVFQRAVSALTQQRLLVALRVSIAGDLVPRLPLYLAPAANECKHAISARLLLEPRRPARPLSFGLDALGTNRDLFWHWPDPDVHVHHEAYLAGAHLKGRKHTLPLDVPWPLPQAYLAIIETTSIDAIGHEAHANADNADADAGSADGVRPNTRI